MRHIGSGKSVSRSEIKTRCKPDSGSVRIKKKKGKGRNGEDEEAEQKETRARLWRDYVATSYANLSSRRVFIAEINGVHLHFHVAWLARRKVVI